MKRTVLAFVAVLCLACTAQAGDKVNERWQQAVLTAIGSFPEHGGYYTGGKPNALFAKTTWRGLHDAYQMTAGDERPRFDPWQAQPSFCSSATYAVLIKALLLWDTKHKIKREAWINMKPRVGIADEFNPAGVGQDDGVASGAVPMPTDPDWVCWCENWERATVSPPIVAPRPSATRKHPASAI